MRYFLLPRRTSPDAPGSSASRATGARTRARRRSGRTPKRGSRSWGGVVTVRALAGLAALNLAYALARALDPLGRSAASALGTRACGSPGSATCSASPRSASSGRRSSPPASRSAGSGIVAVAVVLGVAGAVRRPDACSDVPCRGIGRGPGHADRLLVSAAGIALAGLYLEALFRAARLQSLQAYDAWAFWVPKGKAIFFFQGLDEQVFTTTPNADRTRRCSRSSTPPRSTRWAARTWSRCTCSSGSSSSAPSRRSPGCSTVTYPRGSSGRPLLLVLVVPRFGERLLAPQADVLVDVLVVVAALLLALWLRDRAGWRLAAAAVLLAGAVNTKREGILFAAAVLVVAFARLPAADTGRGSRVASLVVGAGRRPVAHLGRTARHPRGRAVVVRRRPARRRVQPLVRRPLLDRALVGRATRRHDRARRRRSLGRSAPRRVLRASRPPALRRRRLVDGRLRGARRSRRTSPGTRSCATRARSSCSRRSPCRSCSVLGLATGARDREP